MKKGESNMKNNWEKLASVLKLRLFEKFTIDTDRKHKFYFSMHGMANTAAPVSLFIQVCSDANRLYFTAATP